MTIYSLNANLGAKFTHEESVDRPDQSDWPAQPTSEKCHDGLIWPIWPIFIRFTSKLVRKSFVSLQMETECLKVPAILSFLTNQSNQHRPNFQIFFHPICMEFGMGANIGQKRYRKSLKCLREFYDLPTKTDV